MSDQAKRLEDFINSKPDDATVAQIAELMRVGHDPKRSALAYGYEPHPDQREPFGVIYIAEWRKDRQQPKLQDYASEHDWREALGSQFRDDAEAIFRVLSSNLPGGTMYELFVAFLRHNTNLHVVLDEPAVTISELARDFVWEPEQWEAYTDSKTSNSVAWPPEWLLLCQAVEKRYGTPPTGEKGAE